MTDSHNWLRDTKVARDYDEDGYEQPITARPIIPDTGIMASDIRTLESIRKRYEKVAKQAYKQDQEDVHLIYSDMADALSGAITRMSQIRTYVVEGLV